MRWLFALAMGCAAPSPECPPLSEVPVVDADGVATPDVRGFVDQAIADMAGWMGEDGVCVDTLYLVAGPSRVRGRDLYVQSTFDLGPDEVGHRVYESLCLAFDQQREVSARHPRWFGSEQASSHFLSACVSGPRDPGLLLAVQDTCGVDLGAGRQVFMNEVVFPEAEVHAWPVPGVIDVELSRTRVDGSHVSSGLSTAQGAFTSLDAERRDDGMREPTLARIEASTGVVAFTTGPVLDGDAAPYLLSSDGLPLVVEADGGRAWFVGDTWEEVPFAPIPGGGAVSGAVVGDVAWIERADVHYRVDTRSGEVERVADDASVSLYAASPRLGDGMVGAGWQHVGQRLFSDADRVWADYDGATDSWIIQPMSHPALRGPRLPLPDGRVVTWWTALAPFGVNLTGVAVVDPDTGEWWIDADTCGDDDLSDTLDGIARNGEVWLYEHARGADADWAPERIGPFVTRVDVPPR